jgi:hypothetical protein
MLNSTEGIYLSEQNIDKKFSEAIKEKGEI